jgi:hypothetical protein
MVFSETDLLENRTDKIGLRIPIIYSKLKKPQKLKYIAVDDLTKAPIQWYNSHADLVPLS